MKIKLSIILEINNDSDVNRILERVTAKSYHYNFATPSKIIMHSTISAPKAVITVEEVTE